MCLQEMAEAVWRCDAKSAMVPTCWNITGTLAAFTQSGCDLDRLTAQRSMPRSAGPADVCPTSEAVRCCHNGSICYLRGHSQLLVLPHAVTTRLPDGCTVVHTAAPVCGLEPEPDRAPGTAMSYRVAVSARVLLASTHRATQCLIVATAALQLPLEHVPCAPAVMWPEQAAVHPRTVSSCSSDGEPSQDCLSSMQCRWG